MVAPIICVVLFGLCYWLASKSLASGIGALVAVGYFFGIARANLPETFSHFFFDCALLGFYLARLARGLTPEQHIRSHGMRTWLLALAGWPLLMTLVPLQDYLIQLVGLRGNVFMVFLLFYGALLQAEDWVKLSVWVAILNLIALSFGTAEIVLGIEPFFPLNEITQIIYISGDVIVGDSLAYRIPATFANAHAYGGTMTMTVPILIGSLAQPNLRPWQRALFVAGAVAAALGCLLCAARLPVIVLAVSVLVTIFSLRRSAVGLAAVAVALVALGVMVWNTERMQRFTTLGDTAAVSERIAGSVNLGFFETVWRYPLGNGIGGGGTSVPYFLQDRLRQDFVMENEYARLQLELGLPGLLLWLAMLGATLLTSPRAGLPAHSLLRRRLVWWTVFTSFATALIGTGLFTAIPGTALLFCQMGWLHQRHWRPWVPAWPLAGRGFVPVTTPTATFHPAR